MEFQQSSPGSEARIAFSEVRDSHFIPTKIYHWATLGGQGMAWGEAEFPKQG